MDTSTSILSVRQAAEQRRSIRAYQAEPTGRIARAELEEILRLTGLAPSAFNLQPWRFVVVETPEVKEKLAQAADNQRQVRSAPAVIVLYTDMADVLATVEETIHPGMDAAARARSRQTVLGLFGSQAEADREAWAAGQGYIALGYLLLIAEAHGYQTSPMTGFNPAAVKGLLGLPQNARIPALVAIGRGAEAGFPHHRHATERVVRYA